MSDSNRFFAVTGGPGTGKSTLIDALAARGVAAMPEAGRAIIRQRLAAGLPPRPEHPVDFADAMLDVDLRNWRDAPPSGPVMFDRALPDLIGYLTMMGEPVPDRFKQAVDRFRYNALVFVAPFWPQIYQGDGERDQTPQEARSTGDSVILAYRRCGYRPVLLPMADVARRVEFVLRRIREEMPPDSGLPVPKA